MTDAIVHDLILGTIVQALFTAALFAWARHVARKHGGFFRRIVWLPWIALVLQLAGVAFPTSMLIAAFQHSEHVDAAHRAATLAQGISEAMNVTALLLFPALLSYGVSVVASIVGTVRAPATAAVDA